MLQFDLNKRGDKTPKLEPMFNTDGSLMYKGYVPTFIVSVMETTYNYKEGEFAGKAIPAIRFTFQNMAAEGEAIRQTIADFKIVGRISNQQGALTERSSEDVAKNLIDQYEVLKHFLDSFIGQANYKPLASYPKEEVEKALSLNTTGTIEEYVDSWTNFVTFMVKAFNVAKNDKPVFHNDKNKPIPVWLRLSVEYQYKRSYEIPKWVGAGIIEVIRTNPEGAFYPPAMPALSVKELTLSEKGAKRGTPVTPGTPGMGTAQPTTDRPAVSNTLADILNRMPSQK